MVYFRGLLRVFIGFGKNVWGSFNRPYSTYRQLVHEDPLQLIILWSCIGIYFFLVSPIKLHTLHPFLLTLNASRLFTIALVSYIGICLFFLFLGRLMRSIMDLRGVLLTWGYSLIPTLIWFFATSVFYVFLPPPRHETWPGRIFSLLFITFSISLFIWKGILYYLTLRFALKFDLKKIIAVSVIFLPLLTVYAMWLYNLGVFKVPFI